MRSILLLLCLSTLAKGETFTLEDPARLVELLDVVDGSYLKEIQKINALSEENDDDITLLINSPGGMVEVGTSVIDAMTLAKSRGVHFKCITGLMSASMAFIILAHCDERYALPNTKLLFHPVSAQPGRIRIQEFGVIAEQIIVEENEIMRFIQTKMGMDKEKFQKFYFAEVMWAAWNLHNYTIDSGFLKIVTDVKGIKNIFVIDKPKQVMLFQLQNKPMNGEVAKAVELKQKFFPSTGAANAGKQ